MVPEVDVAVTCCDAAQSLLRRRLCGRDAPAIVLGYDQERKELLELMKRTATFGESNSILVIGPRGSGKTLLVKGILEEIRATKELGENFLEVCLNGLLQTDDRIALKEITRQLRLENTVGDRVFGSFAENLQFLLQALKGGGKHSKSILFLVDEFDLFAQHKNQTLLYNLFDVAQSAQAPICVVGLTTRLDVMELLEKRVKSRFSHRQLHLLANPSFVEYMELFLSYLRLPSDFKGSKVYLKEWNHKVEGLKGEPAVCAALKKQYAVSKDVRALQTILMLPVCRVNKDHPYLEAVDFVDAAQVYQMDSKSAMLHGISVLELCLVIAMRHLLETYHGEPFNFEMVFREYQKFCQRRSAMQNFDKPIVLKAFEHLCALELVRPTEGTTGRTQKEYQLMTLLVDEMQVTDALQKYPNCPTEVKQWAATAVL